MKLSTCLNKENTVYEVVEELELPKDTDQHNLIDEIIHFGLLPTSVSSYLNGC